MARIMERVYYVIYVFIRWNSLFDLPLLKKLKKIVYEKTFGGKNLSILRNVLIASPHRNPKSFIKFGNSIELASFIHLDITGGIIIGDRVVISEGTKIYTHTHVVGPKNIKMKNWELKSSPLEICDDAWIASNCIILSSCNRIGKGAVVGAGSIVTKDIPDYSLAAGAPAKIIKTRD